MVDDAGRGPDRAASPGAGAGEPRSAQPVRSSSAVASAGGPAPSGAPHPASSPRSSAALRTGSTRGTRRGWRDIEARLLAIVGRLTERDRLLCRLLDDHRVLTTAQVADVGFTGERRARMRLSELYALDVLDRFRPQTWGSPSPFHWVLGPLGAALVAAEHGLDPADLAWRRRLVGDLAASQRLAHLVGTNGFFCALCRSARTRTGCRLEEWWSERRCATEWGEVVDEVAPPGEVGHLDAVLGRYEGSAERAEHPVERDRAAATAWPEAVEDVEGVQLRQAHPGPALTGEADVGDLGAGEHPVILEQAAEPAVAFGEPAEDGE